LPAMPKDKAPHLLSLAEGQNGLQQELLQVE